MTDKPEPPDLTHPPPGEAVLPLPRSLTPADWLRRALIWGGLLALVIALIFWLDVPLMRLRLQYFPLPEKGLPPALKPWNQLLYGFRDFGQWLPAIVTIAIVWRIDRRRWFIIAALLLAEILTNSGHNALKYSLSRTRPRNFVTETQLLTIGSARETWVGWAPGLRDENFRSFPSGHSSAAFALAGVLAWFYPRLRVVFWPLAVGCAFSRIYDIVHWPGDALAGAMIGYLSAYVALRPYIWALPVIYRRRVRARRRA